MRIVTNMRVYWDQALDFDASEAVEDLQLSRLEPAVANLQWRGFSAEVTPDGRQPYAYDYERVSFSSPWKQITGRYTRAKAMCANCLALSQTTCSSFRAPEMKLYFRSMPQTCRRFPSDGSEPFCFMPMVSAKKWTLISSEPRPGLYRCRFTA
ncbi:MAG: hypothetical protein WKF84_18715 [Pyrinomonadaceae bacterium]